MTLILILLTSILIYQDVKTQTVHIMPLFLFIIFTINTLGFSDYPYIKGVIFLITTMLLTLISFMFKKTWLGLADILIMGMMIMVLKVEDFFIIMALSSGSSFVLMILTQENKIAFIPALLLSFWGYYLI